MKKGVITVYLSLIMLLVFALICSLIESARIQGVQMQLESAVDASILSAFAGFNKELYKQYDLFFFDGSFGNSRMSTSIIEEKLVEYMDYNVHPDKDLLIKNVDFYHVNSLAADINRMAIATDDNGYVFRESAIKYMKTIYGVDTAETILNQYNWADDAAEKEQQYQEKDCKTQDTISLLQEEKEKVDLQNQEAANEAGKQENPTAAVSTIKSMGILELVCKDTSNISQKSIHINELPSNRNRNQGNGLDEYSTDMLSEALFHSYLLEKFSNALSTKKDTTDNLQYQLEYILIGKEHDVDNLKGVVNRLVAIREGVNFAYLLTDGEKISEAECMAATLVGYTGIVPLIEATKYALLLSWAYAESIMDVKTLLAGGKVALIKTAVNWKTDLTNIESINDQQGDQQGDKDGLTYQEYLRILLFLSDNDKTALRGLDLIEVNIRRMPGNRNLKMDYCIYQLEATMEAETKSVFCVLPFMKAYSYDFKKMYCITRKYGYDVR